MGLADGQHKMKSPNVVREKKDDEPKTADYEKTLQIVNVVMLLGALALATLGIWFVVSSQYEAPPIPLGHLVGQFFTVVGASLVVTCVTLLSVVLPPTGGCTRKNSAFAARTSFVGVWGLSLLLFGVFRFWWQYEWQYTPCPCPQYHARVGTACVPCPGYSENCTSGDCLCGDRGTCDESTATCVCDSPNWQVGASGLCDECSERARDGQVEGKCGRCTERWKPGKNSGVCDTCRNGYTDEAAGCKTCGANFAPRRNASGIMNTPDGAQICTPVQGCADDGQPAGGGRWGPDCEAVTPDRLCRLHGDPNANLAVENNKMVLSRTFTSSGNACSYNSDCSKTYSCRGYCAFQEGALRPGALCEEDSDCLSLNGASYGACVSRTCGAEPRVAVDDDCKCTSQPFQGPRCEMCPGYSREGGWSSTICGGRGTCAPVYLDSTGRGYLDTYSHLTCLCSKPTSTVSAEFPAWSGEKCQRAVNEDFTTAFCAPGFFGPDCSVTCPVAANGIDDSDTWGGNRACGARGSCVYDKEEGTAECFCNADDRIGGDGFFTGRACEACAPEFYGANCNTCPKLIELGAGGCVNATYLIPPDKTTCHASCGPTKTCDDGKGGSGMCFKP